MRKETMLDDKTLAVFEECCQEGKDAYDGVDPRVSESVPNLLYLNGRFIGVGGEDLGKTKKRR